MKKLSFYMSLLFAGLLTTACNEEFSDWAKPITNPQPDAITVPGLTASAASANIDLASAGDEIKLITLSSATMPAGTTLDKMRVYVFPSDLDGAPEVTLSAISAADGTFDKATVQEMVVANYGPRPTARTYYAHVYLDGIYNGQAAFIDAGELELNLIPEAPQISDNYYIVGGTLDWAGSAASKEQKFSHSGADVYEDPVFTIVINAAEGDTWFAIGDDEACDAIGNGDWSKLFGTTAGNGESGLEGTLDRRYNLKDDGSFKVPAGAKKIKIDLNMMDRTYTVTPVSIAENYYLIGGPGNWDSSKNQKFSHSSKDVFEDPVFTYTFEGTGSDMWFAFGDDEAIDAVGNNTWNVLFGTKGASEDLEGSFDRRYNLDGDHSFHVDGKAKLYRFEVNMAEMTYKITAVNIAENYYLIGGPGEWNNSKEQKFSHSDKDVFDDPVFTYTFESTGGDMWFAFGDDEAIDAVGNNTWNVLFGTTGASEDLKGGFDRRYNLDGDHSFHVDGQAKYYRFTVNMAEMTYEITPLNFTEYIYEAGVNNEWGSIAQPLYCASQNGVYTGFFYAQDADWSDGKGAFKFTGAFNSWNDGNYGAGDSSDEGGTLINDGGSGNLLATPGFYRADVNMADMTYKLTRINSIFVVGSAVNNDWDRGIEMTYNFSERCWECDATLNEGQIKFKGNGTWDNLDGNWGGTLDNIVNGSNDNIDVPVTGAVHIKFYPLCDTKSYATITAK